MNNDAITKTAPTPLQWEGNCLCCGYDCRGIPSCTPCPECGRSDARPASVENARQLVAKKLRLLKHMLLGRQLPLGWWELFTDVNELPRTNVAKGLGAGLLLLAVFMFLGGLIHIEETVTLSNGSKFGTLTNLAPPSVAFGTNPPLSQPTAAAGSIMSASVSKTFSAGIDDMTLIFIALTTITLVVFSVLEWVLMRYVWLGIVTANRPSSQRVPRSVIGRAADQLVVIHSARVVVFSIASAISFGVFAIIPAGKNLSAVSPIVSLMVLLLFAGYSPLTWSRLCWADRGQRVFPNRSLGVVLAFVASASSAVMATSAVWVVLTNPAWILIVFVVLLGILCWRILRRPGIRRVRRAGVSKGLRIAVVAGTFLITLVLSGHVVEGMLTPLLRNSDVVSGLRQAWNISEESALLIFIAINVAIATALAFLVDFILVWKRVPIGTTQDVLNPGGRPPSVASC